MPRVSGICPVYLYFSYERMTIVWQSHARLRLPVKRNCLIFPLHTVPAFSSAANGTISVCITTFDRVSPFRWTKGTKANNSKTPAYELGARDSISILARHQLLINARGRSSPGGWTLGFAGAITIWLDQIENSRREFVGPEQEFFDQWTDRVQQGRLTLHQQSGSIQGMHLLTLSKFPRLSIIHWMKRKY